MDMIKNIPSMFNCVPRNLFQHNSGNTKVELLNTKSAFLFHVEHGLKLIELKEVG